MTIYTYKKKDNTIRKIVTDRNRNIISKDKHITVFDKEKQGWRTMIKNRILNISTTMSNSVEMNVGSLPCDWKFLYVYHKLDGSLRTLYTDRDVIQKDRHILVWDQQKQGWCSMIKNRILVQS